MSVRALKSGAVEFLTKPFRDQDLPVAIQQTLQHDRAAAGTTGRATIMRDEITRLWTN